MERKAQEDQKSGVENAGGGRMQVWKTEEETQIQLLAPPQK